MGHQNSRRGKHLTNLNSIKSVYEAFATGDIPTVLGALSPDIAWTEAEGFVDAYRTATGNSRGLFQAAVIKLAARADQLRKG